VIIGVVTAFLQITGIITVTPVFLWVVFGIAVGYLAVSLAATALLGRTENASCLCSSVKALLTGILGSILLATVLLAVGIVATSILSAILVGLLLLFFTLTLASSSCLVICLTNCDN
jgi:hypothetical protein